MSTHRLQLATRRVPVDLPDGVEVRGMGRPPEPLDGGAAVRSALADPIGRPALRVLADRIRREESDPAAVIVVSDHTRPVPYRGEDGLLVPLVETLREAGFPDERVTILIGAGSHRNMEPAEIERMLGLRAHDLDGLRVVNHEYENTDRLRYLGRTDRDTPVFVNRTYLDADLKIVTGLVESHFMAGASGGRKGICPGIVGRETLTSFHGADLLSSPHARDLSLERNPLHDEALEVAQRAGCDFLVNVTLDGEKRLTGVFAGDMEEAHRRAVRQIEEFVAVDLDRRYDVVLVPGSYVSVNHYQAAKAAVEGARAVRSGGSVIVTAEHTDPDPVGGEGYKQALRMLAEHGRAGFLDRIADADHEFVQEQWQVQMWCKVLDRIESGDNLVHCALEIPPETFELLPGRSGLELLSPEERRRTDRPRAWAEMTRRAVLRAMEESPSSNPDVLLLRDGPYGIPRLPDRTVRGTVQ